MTDSVTGVVKLSPAQLKKIKRQIDSNYMMYKQRIPIRNDPIDLT